MGIAETDFGHWAYLSGSIDWKAVQSICDLGQQELFTGSEAAMRKNMQSFVAAAMNDGIQIDINELISQRWIRDIWILLGRKITSIDVVGSGEDFLFLDLNEEDVPENHRGRYDFVTNCGTTEHVANQYNSFKIVHDLTKPGGYMYHTLPICGTTDHGFFSYNPKFFQNLALANNYRFLDAFMTIDPTQRPLDEGSIKLMRQDKAFMADTVHGSPDHLTRDFRTTPAGIRVCLQKPHEEMRFRPPLDIRDDSVDVYGRSTT